jgi:hypothetical protein
LLIAEALYSKEKIQAQKVHVSVHELHTIGPNGLLLS